MTREAGVALIRVDNPPVNALGHAVRVGLLQAFMAAERDGQVELIMLYCAGKTFIAGADIREFGQPAQAPILQELTRPSRTAASPRWRCCTAQCWVAGWKSRWAVTTASLTVPPGSACRKPVWVCCPGAAAANACRAWWVQSALDMIIGGEPIEATRALELGLVDALFDDEPLVAGLAHARHLLAERVGVRRVGQMTIPTTSAEASALIAARRSEIGRTQADSFSAPRCLAAIEAAIHMPLIEGLQRERALFLECMASPQRAALIEDFFARRQTAKSGRR
jgi:3-hydroxyacyl-CoA dehydrogenase